MKRAVTGIIILSIVLFIFLIGFMGVVSADCPSGMIGYWKFDQNNTNQIDSSGKGHNGTITSIDNPYWSELGKIGGTLSQDGTGYVDIPDNEDFNLGNNDFTIETWINTSHNEEQSIAGQARAQDAGNSQSCRDNIAWEWLYESNGNITFRTSSNVGQSCSPSTDWNDVHLSSANVHDGRWHYLTISKHGNFVGFYMDSILVSANYTLPSGWTMFNSSQDVAIGKDTKDFTSSFNGQIDEFAIYKGKGLTDSEISQHYNNGLGEDYCAQSTLPTCAGQIVPPECTVVGNNWVCSLDDNLLQDAYVENYASGPATNFETAAPNVKYSSFIYKNSAGESRAVIKINKTALPTYASKVTFSAYFNTSFLKSGLNTGKSYYPGNANKTVLGLYKLTRDWNETNVTWNILVPAFDTQLITNNTIDWHQAAVATTSFTMSDGGWLCWGYPVGTTTYGNGDYINYTITNLYNSWSLDNNYGFYIKDLYGDSLSASNGDCRSGESGEIFGSSESGAKPKLIIEGACSTPLIADNTYWADLFGNPISQACLNSSVMLVRTGNGVLGNLTNFTIEQSPSWTTITKMSGLSSSAIVSTIWFANASGTYRFRANVSSVGETVSSNLDVTNSVCSSVPTIDIISPACATEFNVSQNVMIILNATDPQSTISGTLDFGDGSQNATFSSGTSTFNHVYNSAGTKKISATVINGYGVTRKRSVNIIIIDPTINGRFIASCIASPKNYDMLNIEVVQFNATTSKILSFDKNANPQKAYISLLNANITWAFSDSVTCNFLNHTFSCTGSSPVTRDDVRGDLFTRTFTRAGDNWASLNIQYS